MTKQVHPVFDRFPPLEGPHEEAFLRNFLGVRTRREFHQLTEKYSAALEQSSYLTPQLPTPEGDGEGYFEWITLLESVLQARERYVLVELGAGHGRVLMDGAAALRRIGGPPCHLVGVEAEPTHFQWMVQHFRDNGADPRAHTLIKAAVSDADGHTWFETGHAAEWYGQRILPASSTSRGWFGRTRAKRPRYSWTNPATGEDHVYEPQPRRVRTVCLDTILRALPHVDLLHLDVQGEEAGVLGACGPQLGEKVRTVYIETHGTEIEDSLRCLFQGLGWTPVYDFQQQSRNLTEYGEIDFVGGIQTWKNPRL
jgi:FkbM family methyltransferase